MELKRYQELVLKDLDDFIYEYLTNKNAGIAYNNLWESKGVRIGGINGFQPYNDYLGGIPSVCFKVPTGGGKTILGCAALKHIFSKMSKNKRKLVVWLVPWETILTQTYSNFKNVKHFYRERLNRDFSSKVEIYDKQQALNGANFNPSIMSDQLSILVMSFDSLKATDKEKRKAYEENSSLMPFVSTYGNRERLIPNIDDTALMQVLNQMEPVVVIDESHNAKTPLSEEMIKNLNPSFVLELTATPWPNSNVISIVTASQLKAENMIKLPVIAYNRPTVERVIVEALDLRNSLEKAALKENNAYIRPIVLFQAQPKKDDDSVTFDKIKSGLIKLGIPEEQIAIKTATINELRDIDLMDKTCEIRYIITINALNEGWDCPFAYVLASLANKTSMIDVEQILGRILRQPNQRNYSNKILNMSYVLTSSNDFSATIDSILAGLNASGFSKNDYRTVVTNTMDDLFENKKSENTEKASSASADKEDKGKKDCDDEESLFNLDEINNEIKNRCTNDDSITGVSTDLSENLNINSMLEEAIKKSDDYEKKMEDNSKNGIADVPEDVIDFTNIYCVKDEHMEEISAIRLPIFTISRHTDLFGDDSKLPVEISYLNDGFDLISEGIPSNLLTTNDNVYKVDVESNNDGSFVKKSVLDKAASEDFKKYLSLIPESSKVSICKSTIIAHLNDKFDNIPYNSIVSYVNRIVDSMKTEDDIIALQNNVFSISERIRAHINHLLIEYRYKRFKEKLKSNEICIEKMYEIKKSITLLTHTSSYLKTLYTEEDSKMNSLEEMFAMKISSLDNIKWWHRNKDRVGFAINGYINHYPDFIIETMSGKIILVETKGEHLDGDDSKKKIELGKLWSSYSGPNQYKYFMAFEKNPLVDDCSDLVDNIVDLIGKL